MTVPTPPTHDAPDGHVAAELVRLEEEGWQALRAGGGGAVMFFDGVLDTQVTMILSDGAVITSRAAAIKAMSGSPWDDFHLGEWAVRTVSDDVAVVTYAVTAHRGDAATSALASSVYVRRPGGWRLALHQQTPR